MEAISNAELLGELKQWALAPERKILPESFDCPHYNECNASLQKKGLKLDRGRTCQMSYVGKEYGKPELAPGKPFRLVIVGIDPGANYEDEKLEGFAECQAKTEKLYYGAEPFNPHYKGVIRTAGAILGADGTRCLEHCWPAARCAGEDPPDQKRCVLKLFAQPNLVKCAPAENESRSTKSTGLMSRNCSGHLLSEIELLKPDLIVFHGGTAEWAFPEALDQGGYQHTALPDSPKHGTFPILHEVIAPDGGWKFFVLYLMHPSHGWLDDQWDSSVVERALEMLRSMRAIPPI